MIIVLKKLILTHFKGIKNLTIDFSKKTNIFGENGTGKTTIPDAYCWLLFGKDSQDRVPGDKESNFQIKTYDETGSTITGIDSNVTGVFEVDGKELTLSKTFHEKWQKKKGEAERAFTGNENLYYINEVPSKESEYKAKVNSLIDEKLFKLLCNPMYFSTVLKQQDRREILMEYVGSIGWEDVIAVNKDLKPLEKLLLVNSDVMDIKKVAVSKKKKSNDDIKAIPNRIDELYRMIEDHDFEALEFQKRNVEGAIKSVDEKLIDGNKGNEYLLNQKSLLSTLKYRLRSIEETAKHEAEAPFRELSEELKKVQFEISSKGNELVYTNREVKRLIDEASKVKEEAESLRKQWYEEDSKYFEFDESLCVCPTCKRAYETVDIEDTKEKLLENFNQSKAENLERITKLGKEKSEYFKELQDQIKSIDTKGLKEVIETLKRTKEKIEYDSFNFEPRLTLEVNKEYQDTLQEIKVVEEKINAPTESNINILELKNKKTTLLADLEQINKQLAAKENNEKIKTRIDDLKAEERSLAHIIAQQEKTEYLCDEFIKTKVKLLESNINRSFKYVKFKLFITQGNGSLVECCEALIDGVPFSNANTASQYNAGLDIINALSNFYDVQAPIFIDNRESVNNLIDTDSQIVNLIVSTDKPLRVESEV
jgi:DNA repair exonuclease SbcCD ATPase subunit